LGRFPCITHPSATRRQAEAPVTVRLACVKHAASVQSEPGSNSSVQCLLRLRDDSRSICSSEFEALVDLSRPCDHRRSAHTNYLTGLLKIPSTFAEVRSEILSASVAGVKPVLLSLPVVREEKPHAMARGSIEGPGGDLLSHGEAPHYHRRYVVSLLSSGWDQVVPTLYGRQAKGWRKRGSLPRGWIAGVVRIWSRPEKIGQRAWVL
jgi:hypothetical protein